MTEDAQLWHILLWASGGKLELPKCGYYLIYYNFNNNGIPQMQLPPFDDSIQLKDDENQFMFLERISVIINLLTAIAPPMLINVAKK